MTDPSAATTERAAVIRKTLTKATRAWMTTAEYDAACDAIDALVAENERLREQVWRVTEDYRRAEN